MNIFRLGGARRTRAGWLAAGGVAALLIAAPSSATSTYGDPANDTNQAPDIVSVSVSSSVSSARDLSIRVTLADAQPLPSDAQVMVLMDLDNNAATGFGGNEAAVRYSGDGTVELLRDNGIDLVSVPANGVSARFAAGDVVFDVDRSLVGASTAVGLEVLATRSQTIGTVQIVSSDFAPDRGTYVYTPPAAATFSDPRADEGAAPDITSISLSDGKGAPLVFLITTANYPTLPKDKVVGVDLTLAGRPPLDNELFLTYEGSSQSLLVDREEGGFAAPELHPRATARYENGVLTLTIDRRELAGASLFRFGVVTADLVGADEANGLLNEGDLQAVDVAPDGLTDGSLYTYRLANPPPVRLAADRAEGDPPLPVVGRRFAVTVVVRRSDSFGTVRRGSVSCTVAVGRGRVHASGSFVGGKARCLLHVPPKTASATLHGQMEIRSAGKVVTARFSFAVREHAGG